jgi:hypothetical protein
MEFRGIDAASAEENGKGSSLEDAKTSLRKFTPKTDKTH